MEAFVLRLVITIGVIFLTQFVLDSLGIQEPARKIILLVVVLIGVLFLVGGATVLNLG